MECIQGRSALQIDALALARRLDGYRDVLVDLGTGDGRFVRHMAEARPARFAIGIDVCRENLRQASRRAPPNALYLIASAQALPYELYGLATELAINFPWGSLLGSLLEGDAALTARLTAVARPGALLEVRLNGGALAEAGWSLEEGGTRVREVLRACRFAVRPPLTLGARELRACPTTWARRLAFGRDPRAVYLRGKAAE
jgi:16S rRNA (adenine(1408)-N(1))-methyltransferase